jgi:hypothetical protein
MPLDNIMYTDHHDEYFYRRAVWYLKFSWLPRRCSLTHRRIWFCRAYKGTAMWTGPGSPVFEHKWIAKEEFLFAKLLGKI